MKYFVLAERDDGSWYGLTTTSRKSAQVFFKAVALDFRVLYQAIGYNR